MQPLERTSFNEWGQGFANPASIRARAGRVSAACGGRGPAAFGCPHRRGPGRTAPRTSREEQFDLVSLKLTVGSEDRQVLQFGLRDQETVEGVCMIAREAAGLKGVAVLKPAEARCRSSPFG